MAAHSSEKPIEILLVEDSPADVLIAREALSEIQWFNAIHVVEDGVEAMKFLRKQGKFCGAPRPDLILLDLNLPRKNGREVLTEIKFDPALKSIPVVVLTTSRAEEDILRAYNLYANCFVVKPVEFDKFVDVLQSIRYFWFSVATLPPFME